MSENSEKPPRKLVDIDDMLTPCSECQALPLEGCEPECFCLGCQKATVPTKIDGTACVAVDREMFEKLVREVIDTRNEKTQKLLVRKEEVWEAQRQTDKWRLACLVLMAGEADRGMGVDTDGTRIPYDGIRVVIPSGPDEVLDDLQGIEDRFEVSEYPRDDEHRDLLVIQIKRHEESNAEDSAHRLHLVPPITE